MKTDIKQVAYMNTDKPGEWWVWNEFCDKCGKQIRDYRMFFHGIDKPNENKKDYCLDCMREMLDFKLV